MGGNQDNQEQQGQPNSSIDRVNDLINKGQSAYKNTKRLKNAYRGIKAARTAATAARAGATAAQGISAAGGAATAGTGAAATSPAWGTALVIFILFLAIIALFIIVFAGGNKQEFKCETITSSASAASPSDPVIITLDNCTANVVFSWSASVTGGTFSPVNTQSTTYTPPSLPTATPVTITANVCSATDASKCTQSTIDITITQPTCSNLGGECTTAGRCHQDGSGIIPGSTDCNSNVCCNFAPSFKFYCQYDRSYTNCHVIYNRLTGTCSNNGCSAINDRCDIISNGCTPSSVAMALASLGKTQWNPRNTALKVYDLTRNNTGCTCDGSMASTFFPFIRSQGLRVYSGSGENLARDLTFSVNRAKQRLSQGCYLLAAAIMKYNRSLSGSGPHATLITAIRDSDNRITVMDPTWCSSDTNYTTRYLYPNGLDSSGRRVLYDWWSVYAVCP